MKWGVGIDLGGTNLKAVAATEEGTVLDRTTVPTRDGTCSTTDWVESARRLVQLFSASIKEAPAAVGICTPGLVVPGELSVTSYPERLQGLEGLDWGAALAPGPDVTLINDAHAALLGEAWIGAARDRLNVVLFTLGTGVGGAILQEGRLCLGTIGRAGHLGHMSVDYNAAPSITGMPGAIETMIGECTLRARTGGRYEHTEAMLAAVRRGDEVAEHYWLQSVRALACAIGSAINILDPELVLVGGGIAKAGDALFRPLEAELSRVGWQPGGWRVPVEPAKLGEWAGALGALRHAFLSHDTR